MTPENPLSSDVTSDDRLWAALSYPISPLAVIVLFMEDKKNRPFIRFHAIQSIVFNIALYVLITIVSFVTLGIGAICAPILWLVVFWPAYQAYNGKYLEMPVITDFIRKQGWV